MLEYGLLGFGGQQFQDFHADDGVALRIQTGTPHGYSVTLRIDGSYASAYTTLAWQAYEIREFACLIVEAAGLHNSVNPLDLRRGELYLAELEGPTMVGKWKKGLRQFTATHLDAAHHAVKLQHTFDVVVYVAMILK